MHRLIFLGAGFSKPAGLPLGSELFKEIRKLIWNRYGPDSIFEYDLNRYIRYLKETENKNLTPEQIDYEDFLSFLDLEHFLGLKGKDTWSFEGNESQLMVRNAIANILFNRTPTDPPNVYKQFVRHLDATDWIFTFNYDTLLENTLEAEKIPYRLYPFNYSNIRWSGATIDDSYDEVVVLKLHGSIDWFDRTDYDDRIFYAQESPISYQPKHLVFGPNKIVDPIRLTKGPRPVDDPLNSVYKVKNIEPLINRVFWEGSPLILQPSSTKIFYAQPLKEFWWGLQRAGGLNLSLCVVGYSLPHYDKYALQVLYHIFSNYSGYEPNLTFKGKKKTNIRILDYKKDKKAAQGLKDNYRFADPKKTEFCFGGFNPDTVQWLFQE